MAMRFLTTRLMQAANTNGSNNLPLRACFSAPISSSAPKEVPAKKAVQVTGISDGKPKRDSFSSKLAMIFGGKLQPANPSDPPISADDIRFPDIVEKATGEEKLLLLAFENGVIDPYCNLPVERDGNGTKDNPIIVKSFFDYRMIACLCEPMQNSHRYMTVYKGDPKRCQCGHWMKVVDAPRFWEKIPKEDLIQIKFFRDLEAKGKLDKYLETGKLDDAHDHGGHH